MSNSFKNEKKIIVLVVTHHIIYLKNLFFPFPDIWEKQPDQIEYLEDYEGNDQGTGHVERTEVEEIWDTVTFVVVIQMWLTNNYFCLME